MKNTLIFLVILFSNLSCSKTEKRNAYKSNNNILSASLQWETDGKFEFNEIRYTDFPVYTSKKAYPKIYKRKIKGLKYAPVLDSLLLVTTSMQNLPLFYDKYKNGYREKENLFKYYKDQLNDTLLILNSKNLKYQFNAISGFLNDKQIVIPDINNNGDFADDPKLIYPKEFRNLSRSSIAQWDTIPTLDFSYQLVNKEKIYEINREIQVYPRANHRHAYLLEDDLNEALNSYTLILELKDYAKGKITRNSVKYTIAVQGKEPWLSDIVIKPDSVFYSSHNLTMQSFFSYKKGDTVNLGDKWFKIKGISPDFEKIEFSEVTSRPTRIKKGIQFGKNLNNRIVKDLNGTEKYLFSEMNDKGLMLIDFWGTWCGPCKALTPKLIDMHKSYSDKVSFVSIAYDKNVNDVKSYTKKNNMDWFHGFVDRKNKKNTIIDAWNIKSYPTFILTNSNQQMLYMGSGNLALDEINQMIRSF